MVMCMTPTDQKKVNKKVTEEQIESSFDEAAEHITAFRSVLIKSAITVVLMFVVIFSTIRWWFPIIAADTQIVVMGPFEVIRFYLRTSAAIAIGLSVPMILYFLWGFMRPRLIPKEVNILKGSLPMMIVLFLAGLAFGYFIVHPISYFFLIGMGERNFDVLVTADEYMSFLLVTTLPFGLIFQLPLVVLFLHFIDLLDSEVMTGVRKYAYFALLVITALIAPPDLFTHLITLTPMILLYELSIILVRRKEERDKEKQQ